ncbi:MAG: hypothetical protein KGL39_58745 [Patescibacteria group bacterium]|nr:hypothetical protein [Patescibacteria group bacterium]
MSVLAKSEQDPENAWQTPPELVERIRTLFGGAIDLDPATTSRNPVQARRCYTPAEDGILMPWAGRVYCNPPYGRTIAHWADKAITEAAKPGVQIVMLMPARTDAQWFQRLAAACDGMLFFRGRLSFVGQHKTDANGNVDPRRTGKGAGAFPSVLVALNIDLEPLADLGWFVPNRKVA